MTDLNNYDDLVAHAQDLERRIEFRDRELASQRDELLSIRNQRDEAAAALLAIIQPELERMVEGTFADKIEHGATFEDMRRALFEQKGLASLLDDRVAVLEAADKSTDIRDEVREMIMDGEIVVSLDVM